MKSTHTKKRIEFEKIIKQLGYRDQSPILQKISDDEFDENRRKYIKTLKKLGYNNFFIPLNNGKKFEFQILENLSGSSFSIFYFHIPYCNKKTYLYNFFLENYNKYDKNEMKKELKILTKNILYNEKTRIGEIGWTINNSKNLIFLKKENLKKIYFEILKKGKKDFLIGNHLIQPKVGDILVSKPDGGRFSGMNLTETHFLKKRKQRGHINTKLGFGSVKEHNSQYLRYDENLIPRPI